MQKINIAVDGKSSCGKSTLARKLAGAVEYVYIDTGAMYRAVTLYSLQNNLIENGSVRAKELIQRLPELKIGFWFNPEKKLSETRLNGMNVEKEIRQMDVSRHVSEVSKIHEVRQKLLLIQRNMAEEKGVVMDGRDIGTVVLPGAKLKIFLTAADDVRAQRRYRELLENNQPVTFREVKENLLQRDYEDSHRKEAPLRRAHDAILLDNSSLTPDETLEEALRLFRQVAEQTERTGE